MSNPINSLKKVKRAPLTIPEMSKASPTNNKPVSAYDGWEDDSREKASPKSHDFNMGYLKNISPRSNNSSRASFNKHPILGLVSIYYLYKTYINKTPQIDLF